jgi:hypothetical protein
VLDQRSRADLNWPLWVYGKRGEMERDVHWPTLVDGSYYTSKEKAAELRKQGHNVSTSYARTPKPHIPYHPIPYHPIPYRHIPSRLDELRTYAQARIRSDRTLEPHPLPCHLPCSPPCPLPHPRSARSNRTLSCTLSHALEPHPLPCHLHQLTPHAVCLRCGGVRRGGVRRGGVLCAMRGRRCVCAVVRCADSYLIHAYKGRTQDVGREQISRKAFRDHNPNSWYAEDGLSRADER